MEDTKNVKSMNTMASGALILSLIALIVAGIALNRAGSVSEATEMKYTEAEDSMALRMAKFEAVTRLNALKARQEARLNYPEFESEMKAIRDSLEKAYVNAKGETKEEWQNFSVGFDAIATDMKARTWNVFTKMQAVIDDLRN